MADIYSKGQKSVDGISGGLRYEQDNNRIIGRDENNVPSLIIDSDPINGFEMKISKPTVDVTSATNDQLIFNSSQNVFKIVAKGTTMLTSPNMAGTSSFVTVTHNLGYRPIVFAFASFSELGTRFPLPHIIMSTDTSGTVRGDITFEVQSDNTTTFIYQNRSAAINNSVLITYYLLQETAN